MTSKYIQLDTKLGSFIAEIKEASGSGRITLDGKR